jgi:hypothetical protein
MHNILRAADFTGSMPLKSEKGIIFTHPMTIVNDLNQVSTTVDDLDYDLCSSGIDSIFYALLDHRGRSLYDFTCCYAV